MIPLFKVFMAPTAKEKVGEVLDSGFIGQGPKVEEFEENLKKWFDNKNVQTLNAGTSALHMALHLLKNQNHIGMKMYFKELLMLNITGLV
jgi:dTDP-4-amino-4,6-dideoxygalactose transaminase